MEEKVKDRRGCNKSRESHRIILRREKISMDEVPFRV